MKNAKVKFPLRERLFEWMTDSYQEHSKSNLKQVSCPVCCKLFSFDDLKSRKLTDEHIIPEALGGKLLVLGCRVCNNYLGSKVDSHLVNEMRSRDAANGKISIPVTMFIGGHRTLNLMQFRPDVQKKMELKVVKQASDPKAIEGAMRALKEGQNEIKIEMRANYIEGRAKIALLKTAYLGLFLEAGYKYIFNRALDPIRSQLKSPLIYDSIFDGAFIELNNFESNVDRELYFFNIPEPKCILVTIKLKAAERRYRGVFMPLPNSDPFGLYSRLRLMKEQGWSPSIKVSGSTPLVF